MSAFRDTANLHDPNCGLQVSMMAPDYRLIAEVMLFADGFSSAKVHRHACVQQSSNRHWLMTHGDELIG